jgi:Trk K+ transport system NAD-binding subunit
MIPSADAVLQDGDLVHILVASDDAPEVEGILAASRESGLRARLEGSS